MKKILILNLALLALSSCSSQTDQLLGSWVSDSGDQLTIDRGHFGFNYIIASNRTTLIGDTCSSVVLFSNSGFNCFKFPDKTARLTYQPGLTVQNDVLIADSIQNAQDEIYHHVNKLPR